MHGRINFYLELAGKLDLSEEQITKLRNQEFEFDKGRVKRHADLQTAQIELRQLKTANPVDPKKVEAKIREVFAKRADEAVAIFAAQMEADKVLTEAQRAQIPPPAPRPGPWDRWQE